MSFGGQFGVTWDSLGVLLGITEGVAWVIQKSIADHSEVTEGPASEEVAQGSLTVIQGSIRAHSGVNWGSFGGPSSVTQESLGGH